MGEHEDRLSNLEAALQGLKLVTNGMSDLIAKYPPLPKPSDKPSIDQRISALEKAHEKFRIVGGVNTQVSGSLKHGFCVNNSCPGEDQPGLGPQIPPTVNGACCIDGECHITNQASCINAGGDYQGDGTDCDPNPCETPCLCGGFEPYEAEGICYRTLTIDGTVDTSCGGSGLSDVVDCATRFRTITCVNTPCIEGWTGSCTFVGRLNDDCEIEFVSCDGNIFDEHGVFVTGCLTNSCDCQSAAVGTKNVSTYSEECTP